VGGPDCSKPYDMALLNVSAMSFGALSGDALRALNQGAAKGGFAHDTGEGGLNPEEVSLPPKVEPGEAWGFAVAKLKEVLTSREG
jgi:glutamate synthase domain-containing protein 2